MADNEEHLDREEKIDKWIFEEGIKKATRQERRRKIIPSSTDSITHTPVGSGLDAMEKVAFYLGDHPELPIVEMGVINKEIVGLTFGKPVKLEYPFEFESDQGGNHWNISHQDALSLSTGRTYGWQAAGLTAIGNSPAGDKMLLNTNRWHVMGLAGLDQFISAVMVGQVMEHAAEPWTVEHHIWLVGYRELGPKLVNFLTQYHDESNFHLVETVEQITADDIKGTTATLYVKNSNAASLAAFERIRADSPDTVGMLTDTVVTERAMFISENDDGTAAIVNAAPYSINFFPNIIDENNNLYLAMEMFWDKHLERAEQARQAVESLTIEDFLPTTPEPVADPAPAAPEERTGSTSTSTISAADLEAMFNGGTAERDALKPAEPAVTHAETELVQTQEPVQETAEPNQTAATPAPEVKAEPIPAPTPAETVVAEPIAAYAPLSLLGEPTLHGVNSPGKAWTKPAEAVAYLYFNGLTREGVEVARALSPDDEHEGHNARMRRSRITKAIRDTLPETFRVEGTQWIIDPLTTDLDQILTALAANGNREETLRACNAIDSPLQGCEAWANEPRAQIIRQLREVLEGVMDRAIDQDQFEIVKAVRQATKKL
jgi:hypothetical protein